MAAITAATASPTWRTRSIDERIVLPAELALAPPPPSADAWPDGDGPAVGLEVLAGHHRDTPGRFSAAEASIPRIRAWACGLRTNAT